MTEKKKKTKNLELRHPQAKSSDEILSESLCCEYNTEMKLSSA